MTQDHLVDVARLSIELKLARKINKNQLWWCCQNLCCKESSQGVFK